MPSFDEKFKFFIKAKLNNKQLSNFRVSLKGETYIFRETYSGAGILGLYFRLKTALKEAFKSTLTHLNL